MFVEQRLTFKLHPRSLHVTTRLNSQPPPRVFGCLIETSSLRFLRPTFTPQEARPPSLRSILFASLSLFIIFWWFSALILGFYDTILTMRIVGADKKVFPNLYTIILLIEQSTFCLIHITSLETLLYCHVLPFLKLKFIS